MSSTTLVTDPPDEVGAARAGTTLVADEVVVAPAVDDAVADAGTDAGTEAWAGRHTALVVAALVVAALVRVELALADQIITNDASAYLESGRNLLGGHGFTRGAGRPELHFPPVVPVLLGAAWKLTGDPAAALGLVNVTASTAALLPLAALARRVGGVRTAVAAVWIGALAPGLTEVPFVMGGGSESTYLLLLLSTVALVASLPERTGRARWAAAAGAGVTAGLTYLTRPEGLLLVLVVVGTAVAGTGIVGDIRAGRADRRAVGAALGPALVVLAVMAALAAPYVAHLHRHTGSWELTAKSQDADVEAWRAIAENDRPARDAVLYALDDEGTGFRAGSRPLTALVRADPLAYGGIVGVNVGTLGGALVDLRPAPPAGPFPRWALLPLPVTVLAVWGAWRRRRAPDARLLLAVAAVVTATALGFFVQPRYLLPVTAALAVFAGAGLADLPARLRRPAVVLGAVLLVGPVLVAIPGPRTMFHPREPVEHRIAGQWLDRVAGPDDRLMTRSLGIAFYAGREAVPLPVATVAETVRFARHHGVEHLVVDEFLLRTFRPALAPLFEAGPWPGLELEHEFRVAKRLTRIFRVVDPAPDTPDPPTLGFVGDG